eukprot:3911206-Prymnesium_polylepis.1
MSAARLNVASGSVRPAMGQTMGQTHTLYGQTHMGRPWPHTTTTRHTTPPPPTSDTPPDT